MANSYHQIYLHAVLVVKYRKASIEKRFSEKFFGVIGNLINRGNCRTVLVNGVEDHIHALFALHPTIAPSDLMRDVKTNSSKWLNDNGFLAHRFEWQPGYGMFSFSKRNLDNVYRYVANQEEHHRKKAFREEYLGMLRKSEIPYEEKYIFHEPI